ncbi:hypothetical protein CEK26_003725 [Fusarium fujikuroi]|nr:hypothetical protein CEK27_003717 [Fusarium fujikuroi]QGJ02281.1 hypothetical protein CEK26_003725 [Fusarium fujikuroi]
MADENARTRNDTFDLGIWSFAIMARYGMNPPTMVDLFKDLLVQCRIAPRSSLLPGPRARYLCRAEFLRCHYKTFAASITLHHVQHGMPRWKVKDRTIMVSRDGVKCWMGAQDRVSNRGEVRAVERKVEQRTVDVHGKAISTHLTSRNRCGLS